MLTKGNIINNQYQLVEELGSGLSATVWQAKLIEKEEFCVLKIFNLSNPKRKQDFSNEWEIMQQFTRETDPYVHFGFESFISSSPVEIGVIVSEWAKKGTLANLFENIRLGKETLSYKEKQDLMFRMIAGLSSIHSKKIPSGKDLVHRDLKPANILLKEKTLPFIADFAISSWVESERVTENPIGAIEYMSPEALEGSLSQAMDVWAIGTIFYELLAGKPLYNRATWTSPTALMREICDLTKKAPLKLPDEIPVNIKAIIDKALQKETKLRYLSALEMQLALEKAINQENMVLSTITPSLLTKPFLTNSNFPPTTSKTSSKAQSPIYQVSNNTDELFTSPNNVLNKSLDTSFSNTAIIANKKNIALSDGGKQYFTPLRIIFLLIIPIFLFSFSYFYLVLYQETKMPVLPANPLPPEDLLIKIPSHGMVLVPKGRFLMGAKNPINSELHEGKERELEVEAFYLDLREVTNREFLTFLNANANNPLLTRWRNWKVKESEMENPAANVTPEEAQAYASWLGKRLPTEIEWEYAARGNNLGQVKYFYPWGDSKKEISTYANSKESGKNRPVEVGNYLQGKSPFGILDLAGNVAEWTSSCYQANNSTDSKKPLSKSDCSMEYKIFRGGSYHDDALNLRTTRRFWLAQTNNRERHQEILRSIGFRCAKDLEH